MKNKKTLFDYPKTGKKYSVSFIIPAYNEGKNIKESIEHIFDVGYPYLKEVIVVNDCSSDDTRKVVEGLLKKYPKLKLINNPKNLGNAACSQNVGLKYASGELIAVVDGDSFPARESINKMVGFFDDKKVGAVTCPSKAKNRDKFIEKLQSIEYNVIGFTRKLLDYVDAIYVTPGTLALYRRKALDDIGGFDEQNMTQDIEATWNLTFHGYKRKMCLDTYVTTRVPSTIKDWYRQRRRWNIGGLQCISKYRKYLFSGNILGLFIIPFFMMQLFLGLLGLGIFLYLSLTNIVRNYIFANYSMQAGTSLITLNDFYITPSFLNYLGIILFIAGGLFTILVLKIMKDNILKKENLFNLLFYLVFYLTIYPFIMISAIYKYTKKSYKWR